MDTSQSAAAAAASEASSDAEPESEEEAGKDGAGEQAPPVSAPVPLFPHGSSEVLGRELLNLFGALEGGRSREVIDLAPGAGSLAHACCRESCLYTGVVAKQIHADIIRAGIRLNIVKELILNCRDGYTSSRYLKKSRSVSSTLDTEKAPPEPCLSPGRVTEASFASSPVSDLKPDLLKSKLPADDEDSDWGK